MSPPGVQAVVMAGGEGSRLRPLTSHIPKPMLPVANRPLMEHTTSLLRKQGIKDVVATLQYLSSVVRNYFGDGSDAGITLSYATEDVPLGTAGSVLGARDLLSGTFIVVSGDALTDLDVREVISWHRERGAAATLVLKHMADPLEFGIVMTKETGEIERFLEKPSWGQVFSDTINTGIYVLEPDVLDLIPPDQPYDFSSELFPLMLDKGLPLYGFVTDAYWTDVGNSEAFIQANHDVLSGRVKIAPAGFEFRPRVWVGEDCEIHPSARLEGPSLIGDNCNIGAGATIGPYAVVGDNAIVADDALVARGIVLDRAQVGPAARVRGAVLGRASSLEKGATLEEGAVLGDEVIVGPGALVKPRVRIYGSRYVEAGAIVTESVVRERRASRTLFGSRGVAGPVNLSLTPVVAVRLGLAYGTTLKRGSVVVTGRDTSRAARTIKRAVIAGLNSCGVNCHDLELVPMPLTRFSVRAEQATGGVSVRTSPRDPEVVEVRLFDSDGADLSAADQRKIERIFFREDYRRVGPSKLGELEFPPRALEQYTAGLLRALDAAGIKKAQIKLVVDYAFGPTSLVGPSLLGRLGCDTLAVNAFTDESRPVLVADDLQRLLDLLASHVTNSGSQLGVLLEPGGEVIHLVDDRGRILRDDQALLLFLQHELERGDTTVAVPVSATSACERLAAEHGATVKRTPTGLPALMARAARPEVGFAGNEAGELIFPEFMPAPDALMTFGKTLELLARSQKPLSEIVDSLPEPSVVRVDVSTPWQAKGAVMRRVASAAIPGKLMLLDGIKVIQDDRWALVIPSADEALCHVWAEAPSVDEAYALADTYAALVTDAVDEALKESPSQS
ncbi:MAG: sugar phosphate nucleotidyltransferase [Actinomycetota bacterium]